MAKVRIYRTYRFIDKDPVIDAVKTVKGELKLNNHMIQEISGVSATTLDNWFEGDTRKPQNATVTAVTSALGYVRRDSLNKDGSLNVGFAKDRSYRWREEMDKQADWLVKQGVKPKKRRKAKANGA